MKDIYIFTNSYPYTKSVEIFIEEEIRIAAKAGYNIFIVPTNKDKIIREIPENVTVLPCLSEIGILHKVLLLASMPFCKKFWSMVKTTGFSKKILQGTKYLYGAFLTRHYLQKIIKTPSVLYSYWFSYTALGMALARESNKTIRECTIVSRGHGYDVFADQRNIYIPHREYTISKIDALFPVSDAGTAYLSAQYPAHHAKIKTRRLGIKPIKPCQRTTGKDSISFVSCSSVIKLKRVDLILSMIRQYAINHSNTHISWTHFGDGEMLAQIRQSCERLPENMEVCLKGFTDNAEIRRNYTEKGFDIFVNMSTTEGIPVSIIEAISSGMPVIATDVGGNKEIVCKETGALISQDVQYSDFELATDNIMSNIANLKASAIAFFENFFDAEKNYIEFYQEIQQIETSASKN